MTEEAPAPLNAYLIYVSAKEFSGNVEQLNEFISQNKLVEKWWNYTPMVWMILSKADSYRITEALLKFIGEKTDFIVAKIDAKDTSGYLAPGAWEAFNIDIRGIPQAAVAAKAALEGK